MDAAQKQLNRELWESGKFQKYANGMLERAKGFAMIAADYNARAARCLAIATWRPEKEEQ